MVVDVPVFHAKSAGIETWERKTNLLRSDDMNLLLCIEWNSGYIIKRPVYIFQTAEDDVGRWLQFTTSKRGTGYAYSPESYMRMKRHWVETYEGKKKQGCKIEIVGE